MTIKKVPMIQLTIVTQEKELLSIEVDSITAMTTSGEVTILPGHIPLMSKLADTEFVYRSKGVVNSLAITGGFLNVEPGNRIIVLADAAVRSEDDRRLNWPKEKITIELVGDSGRFADDGSCMIAGQGRVSLVYRTGLQNDQFLPVMPTAMSLRPYLVRFTTRDGVT